MTEEQYKKCIEIAYSFKSECRYFPFLHEDDFIKITISLAKVFNKDITEEEAKKIVSVLKDTEKRQDIESIGWAIDRKSVV